LQTEKKIRKFNLTKQELDVPSSLYSLSYSATVKGFTEEYVLGFNFIIVTKNTNFILKEKRTSRICTIILPYSFTNESVEKIIRLHLRQIERGLFNEWLFYEKVLKKLIKLHPEEFHSIKKGTLMEDKFYGIDYKVYVKKKDPEKIVMIKFNLKSSHRFISRHKKVYPLVSTFVFTKTHMRAPVKLQLRFLEFLAKAQYAVTHH